MLNDYEVRRETMVRDQIAARGVRDDNVLEAMRSVPREEFVPDSRKNLAYEDMPLPIGHRQTISQPYIVAMMSEALMLGTNARVLEIGTGCGYAAAVLSLLADRVVSLECIADLAVRAQATLRRLGYTNLQVICADGSLGWPAEAPYDAIIVTAGGPRVPPSLRDQLATGGRLVMPVGGVRRYQHLKRLTRMGDKDFKEEDLGAVAFVPLIGEQGW